MGVWGICRAAQGTYRDCINVSVWQTFTETEVFCTGLAKDMKLIKFSDAQLKISSSKVRRKLSTYLNFQHVFGSAEVSILPQRLFTLSGGSLPVCCPWRASHIHQLPPDHLQPLETEIKLEKRRELNYFEFLKML